MKKKRCAHLEIGHRPGGRSSGFGGGGQRERRGGRWERGGGGGGFLKGNLPRREVGGDSLRGTI